MEPELRSEVSGRLETISLNPFENDLNAEARHRAGRSMKRCSLLQKIRTDWLRKLERDRRAEMTPLEHGSKAQACFPSVERADVW